MWSGRLVAFGAIWPTLTAVNIIKASEACGPAGADLNKILVARVCDDGHNNDGRTKSEYMENMLATTFIACTAHKELYSIQL